MGIFSKLTGGIFQSKEESEAKAKKIIELKESRIKDGRNLEKKLDIFADFIDKSESDWIDIQDLIECYKKTMDPVKDWLDNYCNITGTYGIKNIELDGFNDLVDKMDILATYWRYKNKISDCRDGFLTAKDVRKTMEEMVDSNNFGEGFDREGGYEEFDKVINDLQDQENSRINDMDIYGKEINEYGKNTQGNSRYKSIVVKRLLKEGIDSMKIYKEIIDSGIVNRIREKYAKRRKDQKKF